MTPPNHSSTFATLSLAACVLVSSASAQTGDTCADPIALPLAGVVWHDHTQATTSGFDGGDPALCQPAQGGTAPHRDFFYRYTVPGSGSIGFVACGVSFGFPFLEPDRAAINIHLGGDCAATCLDWDGIVLCDSETGIGHAVSGLTAGDELLIQVGEFSDPPTGYEVGSLEVILFVANDNCAAPTVVPGPGTYPILGSVVSTSSFRGAAALAPVYASLEGRDLAMFGDAFVTWTATAAGNYTVTLSGDRQQDLFLNAYAGSDCNATFLLSNLSEGPSTLNLLDVQPGDTFLFQAGSDVLTKDAPAATLEIANAPATGFANLIVQPPCLAQPHYQGAIATLATSTIGAATPSGLHLECTDGPVGEFGFVLVSAFNTGALSIFNGIYCLGEPAGRYNSLAGGFLGSSMDSLGVFDANGVLQSLAGNAPSTGGSGFDVPALLPAPAGGIPIAPGSTWSFQVWFRDRTGPAGAQVLTANFSDVVTVTF